MSKQKEIEAALAANKAYFPVGKIPKNAVVHDVHLHPDAWNKLVVLKVFDNLKEEDRAFVLSRVLFQCGAKPKKVKPPTKINKAKL